MTGLRRIFGIARADFLERTRRYSFLLAMLFAVFLGYAAATGKIFLNFGAGYRGVYTSGWIGTLVALVITCFLSLVGFYIVKGSVEHDRTTGVGQILAATPLSKTEYAYGKFLSNFAVLAAMVGVLAVGAVAMQFWTAEDARLDLWALLSPFLLLALPAMAMTAVMALCFEVTPVLRGGFGNVAWFFVWNAGLAGPILTGRRWLDAGGMMTVMGTIGEDAQRYVPDYHGGMSFQIDVGQHLHVVREWRWAGIAWDARGVMMRLEWFAVACAMVVLAALVFDRFDTARAGAGKRRGGAVAPPAEAFGATAGDVGSLARVAAAPTPFTGMRLTPLATAGRAGAGVGGLGRIFLAELRLAVFGLRWWWYAVAAGLVIAEFTAPLAVSRGPILACAWMWCVFVWSAMGARETRFGARPLLFSCANILPWQVIACFLAGAFVACGMGAGAAVRLAAARDTAGLLAVLAGALLLPAGALFLGVLSGTGKPFEALLAAVWYLGPMNHLPGVDFTGAANGARTAWFAGIYLVMAAGLVAAALGMRGRQLRAL